MNSKWQFSTSVLGRFRPMATLSAAAVIAITAPAPASADTYQVGPTRAYKNLTEVQALLNPGDVVEVDGDATYQGPVKFTRAGTEAEPITIRGIRVNGNRPIITGGVNTVQFELSNHYLLENFEITGGSFRCVFVHAAYITIQDTLVRDCAEHGILGADHDAGWLTLDRVEVARSGREIFSHSVYVASDMDKYPGATFRMQNSYIHDIVGGNAVKSRSERNEIYYNWIEGALYRELELIGVDASQQEQDAAPPTRAMNSDVVGNVFLKALDGQAPIVRVGHDSDGPWGTRGRFRFVNNVFITQWDYAIAIQAFGQLESIEAHNNVFYQYKSGPAAPGTLRLLIDHAPDTEWLNGRQFFGSNNFIQTGSIFVPEEGLVGTVTGNDPGFLNAAAKDFRLAPASPLIDAGIDSPQSPAAYPFPSPLSPTAFHPPTHAIEAEATPRPVIGPIDIGVFESPIPGCTYTLSASNVTVSADGATGSLAMMTAPECPWVAASTSSWLAITSATTGEGSTIVTFSARQNRGPVQRVGSVKIAGQAFVVTQLQGPPDGPLAEIFVDEDDVTFTGGDGPVGSITDDGVNGSLGLMITGIGNWSATPRLHLPAPVDISTLSAADRLEISLDFDFSDGGETFTNVYIYFNDDWQNIVVASDVDNQPGYQTFSIDISSIRERLGDQVNDIYFKAGSSVPASGTLKIDNIRFIRP